MFASYCLWLNQALRFLKKEQPLIEDAAINLFTGQQLKVFEQLPTDETTSKCYEHFTKLATDAEPFDSAKASRLAGATALASITRVQLCTELPT